MMNAQQPTVPSALLPEILEFSPQLLLDDIINYANEAITNTVDALEGFLFRWASEREQRIKEDWDSTQEVEQGLVAFQTLLESHTDIAFDFFETWSLRNIFAIPADLPVVVPHQENLDLDCPPERETELMTEMDDLRRKIDAQRRLKRLLTRAVRLSSAKRRRSERRLQQLSFLQAPQVSELMSLPEQYRSMFSAISSLPPLTPEAVAAFSQSPLADPGKRPWEVSKMGYLDWASKQVLAKAQQSDGGAGSSVVGSLVESTAAVAKTQDLRRLIEVNSALDNA
ncbi:Mis12-domain-containing protein [Suillus subalutaceus]|uniref:Mis12-domain-containing protein n=1 Tax=Suillus subalutaceus TaxID=48586 RepID=UPI001B87B3B1|nr:Mis12-domain-containing protein [Suillus subalutaceus]KAG1849172.1 Mis12-domain-containing protein [Suillus subalutaceus]